MINHVVLIKFKPGVSEVDIEELEKILDELPNKIIEIHAYEFGRDLLRSKRSYDFALTALFANLETLNRYRKHPDRMPAAKKIQEIAETIATVDFEGYLPGSPEISQMPEE
jgi:hypothetical protein